MHQFFAHWRSDGGAPRNDDDDDEASAHYSSMWCTKRSDFQSLVTRWHCIILLAMHSRKSSEVRLYMSMACTIACLFIHCIFRVIMRCVCGWSWLCDVVSRCRRMAWMLIHLSLLVVVIKLWQFERLFRILAMITIKLSECYYRWLGVYEIILY